MVERQFGGMQCLARQTQHGPPAIQQVANQGVTARGHVHPDLVGAAGVQPAAHGADRTGRRAAGLRGRIRLPDRQALDIGARRLAAVHHRHAQSGGRVAPDRCLDAGLLPGNAAMRQRQVDAAHLPRGNLAHQRGHRRQGLGNHHQATGVLVEPVNDTRPRQDGGAGMVGQQAVEQCARPVARRRMHHQPDRFVDHQQLRILVDDGQRHGLGPKGQALGGRRQCHLQPLPDLDLARRGGLHLAVELHVTAIDQLLQPAARKLGCQRHQRPVQPLAMLRRRHDSLALLDLGLVDRLDARLGLRSSSRSEQQVDAHVGGRHCRQRRDRGSGH